MSFGPPVTPLVIKYLLIANGVVFILQQLMPELILGAVFPKLVWQGGYLWQPFTYMWLHDGLGHVAMNMFALWMFGSQLALAWSLKRFLRYYLICGIGAGFLIASYPYLMVEIGLQSAHSLEIPTLGASGAVYGVLLAYSLTWPDRTIMLIFPPVAFRAIWLIPGLFFMSLFMGGSNISHIGHLGGVLIGWIYLRRRGQAGTGKVLSASQLKNRWRRYRMRQKLRAVRYEEQPRRDDRDDDERRLH